MTFYRSYSLPGGSTMDDQDDIVANKRTNFTDSISMATIRDNSIRVAQSIHNMFRSSNQTDSDGSMENAWIQAVYNSVVFLILSVAIFVLIAVYYVLEPFLHPLLWAVLVGMFLHPFKHTATDHIEQWLTGLEHTGIPLAAGVLISPYSLFNYISSQLEFYLVNYFWYFLVLLSVIVCLYLSVTFNIIIYIQTIAAATSDLFTFIDDAIPFVWLIQVLLVLIVVGLGLCYIGSPTSIPVRGIVITIWYLVLSIVSNLVLGYVGVPLVTILFIGSLVVHIIKSVSKQEKFRKATHNAPRRKSLFQKFDENILENSLGIMDYDYEFDSELGNETTEASQIVDVDSLPYYGDRERGEDNLRKRHTVQFEQEDQVLKPAQPPMNTSASEGTLHVSGKKSILKETEHKQPVESLSNKSWVFLILTSTCLIVFVWQHMWLLFILTPAVAWVVIRKYILPYFSIDGSSYGNIKHTLKSVYTSKRSIVFPQPIPIFFTVCANLDRSLLRVIKSSVGSIISGGIIVAMIVGGIAAFVFFLLQVEVELAYSVSMMKNVLDSSVAESPWIQSVIPDSNGINSSVFNSHLEQFADQGYHYGRSWLKNQVELFVNDSGSNSAAVVNQILLLYDNFYQVYVYKNKSHVNLPHGHHHHEMEGLREHLFHEVKSIITENMETIVSIMKTLWSVLSVNISIALSIVSSLSYFIFSGGTMILNMVVFISALFYLLTYSKDTYLPEQWLSTILPKFLAAQQPSSNESDSTSFSSIIRSVFHASFDRACFYGLYTWLVLSLLGIEVTVVPSVLASVTGAIPFIGPYWVSIPAVLELWLIKESPLLALLTIVLFLAPVFTVDNIINSEIQGGHVYLTGLAIAGGVYFAGLEGAIFGPILLCCLLFLFKFLTSQY